MEYSYFVTYIVEPITRVNSFCLDIILVYLCHVHIFLIKVILEREFMQRDDQNLSLLLLT